MKEPQLNRQRHPGAREPSGGVTTEPFFSALLLPFCAPQNKESQAAPRGPLSGPRVKEREAAGSPTQIVCPCGLPYAAASSFLLTLHRGRLRMPIAGSSPASAGHMHICFLPSRAIFRSSSRRRRQTDAYGRLHGATWRRGGRTPSRRAGAPRPARSRPARATRACPRGRTAAPFP